MRIMTAMYTFRKGGAYERFKMMIETFLERGCEVHCLSLTPIQIDHPRYHNKTVRVPFKNGDTLLVKTMVLALFPLYALWVGAHEKMDLFVAFGALYASLLAMPKWILRTPMVTFIRSNRPLQIMKKDFFHCNAFLNKLMEYVAFFSSNRIVAVNTTMGEEILRIVGRRKEADVRVLFNNIPVFERSPRREGFHARARFGIPEQAKVLVTAGVLTPGKNFEILVKSLSRLLREDIILLLIGDCTDETGGGYRESLRNLVQELGLGRRVILTGWLHKEELWEILSGADLFVLPSKSEGMPNVLLEALGCDLPCLGSNVPGVKEILQYDELLFDPSDQEGLTKKIETLLSDPHFMENVKRLCQERREIFRFDWRQRLFEVVTKDLRNPHERPLWTNPG